MRQKEGLQSGDIFAGISLILGVLVLSQFAFSKNSRKIIGERDGWACTTDGCDKSFAKGFMMHAAHNPEHHDPADPLYDDPSSGAIQCVDHHLAQHEKALREKPYPENAADQGAVNLLSGMDRRTWEWRANHPNAR